MTKYYNNLFSVISATLFFVVFIVILWFVDFSAIQETIIHADIYFLIIGLIVYVGNNCIRAFRFQYLLNVNQFYRLIFITGVYNLITGLLPMGSGEFSFVILMKKYYPNITLAENFSYLIITRMLDYLTVLILLAISTVTILLPIPMYLLIIIFAISIALVIIVFNISQCLQIILKVFRPVFPVKIRILLKNIITCTNQLSKHSYNILTLYTVVVWIGNSLVTYLVLRALHFNFTFIKAIYFNTFNIATQILPINSFAGLGLKEVTFSAILLSLGYPKETVLSHAIEIHMILLALLLAWGIICYLFLFISVKASSLK